MRFLIADDHTVVRMGVRSWLENEFGNVQIDEAACAADVLSLIRKNTYSLLVIDVQMPDTSDFGLLQNILIYNPDQAVIVMSVLNEEVYGPRFLQAGARCYLPKDSEQPIILQAVRKVLSGKRYITEKIADALLNQQQANPSGNPFEQLTDRETEVVSLLLSGSSNIEISKKINVQSSTVGNHKMKIFEKLGVQTIVELINLANAYHFHVS